MNWDDLRIFLAIARTGQLLGAARKLGLNHTTVARRLTALETNLNTLLVQRRTNGCELTPAGQEMLASAERMEAEMLNAQAHLGNADIALSGTVRIGAPDGFGVAFLAPRLSRFSLSFPDLTLQLVPVPRSFSLSRREVDIAITVERPQSGRLIARKLTDYSLGLYAHQDYLAQYGSPQNMEELNQHRLIGYVEDLVASPDLDYAREISRDWKAAFEVSSALGQVEAVKAGAGIGILHGFIAREYPQLREVLPIKRIKRAYWQSYHESTRSLRRIHAVADFIADEVETDRHLFE